ncbi:hypothetical protein BGX23_005574 [Mortierella sp. AD031]|nr:hypothetical protein BGX23_005574 [Mortierella sp. AD031]
MYGGEAWMMDQDGLVAGSAGRSRSGNEKPWNPYGRSSMSSSKSNENAQDQAGSESSVDNQSGAFSDTLDRDYMGSLDMEIDDNTDEEDNDTEEYFEDDEYEMDESNENDDEETGLGENDQDEDNFLMGLTTGATPQKAYIDIWNEGSDTLLSEDDYLELEDDYQTVSKAGGSQQSLIRSLDPNTNYMTYLPYAGLTNQLYGMLRAIMVAKSLGRTLILPPITTSSHDNSKQNQPWSDYFDLETFKQLSGVDLVELKDLRQTDRVSAVEDLKCHVTCGFGSLRPLDFTAKEFLRQWKFDLSMTQFEIETTEFNKLVPALRSQENEHMLCITNGYKIAVPDKDEWDLYGRYFYFTPSIDQFFAAALEKLSARNQLQQQQHRFYNRDQDGSRKYVEDGDGSEQHLTDIDQSVDTNDQPYEHMNGALSTNTRLYNNNHATLNGLSPVPPHGPFISIHARRGDFVEYCQQQFPHDLSSCLPTTQELASTLNDLLVSDPSLRGLPVYVSTDEDRPEELAEFGAMGWQVLDDAFLGSSERLGVFGPMMMDQVFMSQAQVLIGVRTSTFSKVGAYRQEDWYGRRAVLM